LIVMPQGNPVKIGAVYKTQTDSAKIRVPKQKKQTRIKTLILIISTSFGESLFTGSHVTIWGIWGKTVLKQREKYTSEHSTHARELEGPHPEANWPKPKRKDTSAKHRGSHIDPRAQMTC